MHNVLKSSDKKHKKSLKAEAKLRKKEMKANATFQSTNSLSGKQPKAVIFAEAIRGILYIILAISIIAGIILGQTGVIITLDDIIANLMLAQTGKLILAVIAITFFIFGLKNLRILK